MGLVDRAKNILVTPKTEWEVVATEAPNPGAILTGYVLPLALIPAIATLIGWGFIGVSVPFLGTFRDLGIGIAQAVQTLLGAVIGVYLSAFVISKLAPNFQSDGDFGRAMQLVAYSYTPVWVAGILMIFPAVGGIVGLIAMIYGLYLLYLGFPRVMRTPQERVIVYMVVSIVVIIVITIVIAMILGALLGAFGLATNVGAGLVPDGLNR